PGAANPMCYINASSANMSTTAGLAIGHTGHLPGGPIVIFHFYGPMFFLFVCFCNGINNERWWIGQMLADV
ncbi:hypothetical protein, partial [Listeria monocytogenes]|uniref:hypothetical protein n=1 Tax=Listeria monocytogenes TaxID=1639 RepID=UPI00350E367C